MDWIVAVRSYNKPKELKNKTLKTLEYGNVPKSKIYIFVASQEQKEIYQKEIGTDYNYVVGIKGVAEIDNFIIQYFPEGQKIIQMDDDVSNIEVLPEYDNPKNHPKADNLPMMFDYCFEICEKYKVNSWGWSDVTNRLFQSKLRWAYVYPKFLCGCISGFVNDHSIEIKESLIDDFERSYLFIEKDHKMLYIPRIIVEHKVEKEFTEERLKLIEEAEERLLNRFPKICELREKRLDRFRLKNKSTNEIFKAYPDSYWRTDETFGKDFECFKDKSKETSLF